MTSLTASTPVPGRRGLHIALWAVQGLLAFAFLGAGFMKATAPLDQLAAQMSFVTYTPGALVRFVGVAEVLGAVGLILPAATRVLPMLTPAAAAGLTLVMVLAAGTHLTHGEAPMILPNIILGGLAAFVCWGRLKKTPIASR